MLDAFLPVTREEMQKRGWESPDFLFVCGDAYVDHPSFGHAVISRLLESRGFRVGMITEPDWRSAQDFMKLGRPRLGVLVTSGVLDSMINNYTAAKKRRREDLYAPGGKAGKRPDRALIVYCNRIREAFGDIPIIIGGLEASLRRFAHYDYWQDAVRSSILIDSDADLLVFGNGEKAILEIASLLERGVPVKSLKSIFGTAFCCKIEELPSKVKQAIENQSPDIRMLSSKEEVVNNKRDYAKAFMVQYKEQNPYSGKILIQPDGNRLIVQNRPAGTLMTSELDALYSLPYTRRWHPQYDREGGVPALSEVQFSITSHRGCYGGCSFCAIGYHQGRVIQARSQTSILEEAKTLTGHPDFKGYIHDVGGPTANFRKPACKKQGTEGACANRECLYPEPCKNLEANHDEYMALLKSISDLAGVKKVFVRSGIRFDYVLLEKKGKFLETLCKNHVSGQLKVAPEHVSKRVLHYMGKPGHEVYESFAQKYQDINKRLGKKQFLVPYFISGHPGSTLDDAIELALYIKKLGYTPEQVQQFIPIPGTLSACMYYTGLDPRDMTPLYVPRSEKEQEMQRALLQFSIPRNKRIVEEALIQAGRKDLIGFDNDCLIRPVSNRKPDTGSRKPQSGSRRNDTVNRKPKHGSGQVRIKKKTIQGQKKGSGVIRKT